MWRKVGRLLALVCVCALALQLYFAARIALMIVVDPQSTSFQRAEILRILATRHELPWRQDWRDYEHISPNLKRAVIASEDAGFVEHSGVEWDAIEAAGHKTPRA
jgi:monofunctional biosynthetic peptidoglycan transglycosylase